MKTVLIFLMLACAPLSVFGMGDEYRDIHTHSVPQETGEILYSGTGKVKSISEDHMSLRIFHDPIPALKWPAMNMRFEVTDHDLTHPLEIGDAVRFEFIQKEGKQIITKISK